jgi:hypothetical protein
MFSTEERTEALSVRLREWAYAIGQFAGTEGGDLRDRLLSVAYHLQQSAEAAERPLA